VKQEDDMIEIGQVYEFDYPAVFTTLPEYTAHAGQRVTVVRELAEDECENGPVYEIVAEDGWIGCAPPGELIQGGCCDRGR
jgi:hypothetical protein